jgi:hypothetical protein
MSAVLAPHSRMRRPSAGSWKSVDASAFDAAVGSWLAGRLRAADQRSGWARRALAVDGKAVRGTRYASNLERQVR